MLFLKHFLLQNFRKNLRSMCHAPPPALPRRPRFKNSQNFIQCCFYYFPAVTQARHSGGFKGVQGAMAPGLALMITKRGPAPKNKDRNCKKQGSRRCFWPWAPQSLKPPLARHRGERGLGGGYCQNCQKRKNLRMNHQSSHFL